MSHKSRRPPPIECPLASLGHNSPSSHHPLSSSPLNPSVYQRTTSPLLNINSDGIIQYSGGAHETDDSNKSTDEASTSDNQMQSSQSTTDIDRTMTGIGRTSWRSPEIPADALRLTGMASDFGIECKVRGIDYSLDGNSSLDECYTTPHTHHHQSSRNEQLFIENKMRSFFIQENGRTNGGGGGGGGVHYKSKKYPHVKSNRYCLENNLNNRIETLSPNYLRRPSSPSETSESDRYLIERTSRESPAPPVLARSTYNFLANHHRTPSTSSSTFADGLTAHIGRFSPSYDQGYATLMSPSPSSTNSTGINMRNRNRSESVFDKLTDDLCIRILSWVDSCDLSSVSKVCKRFDSLVWRPQLWKIITLKGEHIRII